MKNFFFILGASDPEMAAIEAAARTAGATVAYATADGKRVHPANAYKADGIGGAGVPEGATVVVVECRVEGVPPDVLVDHHQPGDPGYGRPAAEFWPASSIGQAFAALGLEPTAEAMMVAAADHCLPAAYRGECEGVDPDALAAWRAASRAAFQKRSVEEVLRDMEAARVALATTPKVVIAGTEVSDFGNGTVPELPEAAARDGVPFLATVKSPDGRRKVTLMAAPAHVVTAWMASCGLRDVFGDPARGFAGGYL